MIERFTQVHAAEKELVHSGSLERPSLPEKMLEHAESLESRGLLEDAAKLRIFAEEVDRVERESRTDELTGLLNRRGFKEEWSRYTNLLKRERAKGVTISTALLAIDLDDFKNINDTVGHEAGDRFLRLVAEKVSAVTRDTDVVGRLGGDEFAVFLFDTTAEGSVVVARKIREDIEEINSIMRAEYPKYRANASASIGIATINGEGQLGDDAYTTIEQHPSLDEIKRYADYVLYVEKKLGGKRGEVTLRQAWEMDADRKLEEAFLSGKR